MGDFLTESAGAGINAVHYSTTATDVIKPDTGIMLMNGRRYKVKSTTNAWAGLAGHASIELTESFSGQHFMSLCADCVNVVATTTGVTTLTVANTATFDLAKGDVLLVGSNADIDSACTVDTAYAGATDAGSRAITCTQNRQRSGRDHCCRLRRRPWLVQGHQHERLPADPCDRVFQPGHLPVRQPVRQPRYLRRLHRPVQLLQGLHQRQLRHPEHACHVNGSMRSLRVVVCLFN